MLTILLLGSNPSTASPNNNAFDPTTKSGKIVAEWLKKSEITAQVWTTNVSAHKTQKNKPLTVEQIKESLPSLEHSISVMRPDKIIAFGKTAARALTLLGKTFYEMPHPSGLNRQLNNKEFVEGKIKGLKEYCSDSPFKT